MVKPEGRKLLGRSRLRWKNNVKMDFREVARGKGLDRSGPEQGQVAGSCKCGNEPLC